MYRDPAIAKALAAKYAKELAALRSAIAVGDEFMVAARGHEEDNATDAALATLFTRMYNNVCAATILLEEGYGIEGGMLTRAVLESFFNVTYILGGDSEALSRRYFAFGYVSQFQTVKDALEAGLTLREGEFDDARRERQEHWDKHYGWDERRLPMDWSGLSLFKKARESKEQGVYLLLGHHFNQMVHGSLGAYSLLIHEEEGVTGYSAGPHDIYITVPMPALGLLFTRAVQLIAEHFGLPAVAIKASEAHQEIFTVFKPVEAETE